MNAEKFFQLVARMRKAQQEYFKTRSGASLQDSKRYEKEVDAEIKRVTHILQEKANPKLDLR